ncbi:hypothetical protein TrCOL_g12605 [Triparma columacea]|uniref:Glucose-methanol-choline oxidoreductase N-terminal domain-containing protein n=1 Tax=Triparma columacea TaxID=722753 RepID=A0A9W7LEJ6_9STRA|nr:hypothetical protein TrCOL_g12605 [Triparma columacea]
MQPPPKFIIVGAGTSGSLLASRLSKIGKTLLLEAGGSNVITPLSALPGSTMTPWLHVPLGYLHTMNDKRTNWGYKTHIEERGGEREGEKREINYPRGKVLGGCSSINGMIYMKGNDGDYDGWNADAGTSLWGSDSMNAAFGRLSKMGWPSVRQRLRWDVLDDFATGASSVRGCPIKRDSFNNSNEESVGYFNVNQDNGRRVSAYQCFVDKEWGGIRGRGKVTEYNGGMLTVRSNATVKRLLFEDDIEVGGSKDKVVGVEWWDTDAEGTINDTTVNREVLGGEGGEVILAAGAIGSPQLLAVSGVGSGRADERVELPGVGENLHDHLQLRSVYRLKEGTVTLNSTSSTIAGQVKIGLDYIINRSGPLSMAPSQLGCFLKSDPGLAYPDLQYHCQPLSLDKFGDPLHPFPGFTAAVCNLRPTSRGTVKARSDDVRDGVDIDNKYLSTENDREVAARGLRITREIVMGAMKDYQPSEVLPGLEYSTTSELADAATRVGTSIFHPVGTCKMGSSSDEMAVVDEELKVRGLRNCRVIDASVMPKITSGNTNTPTLAIAERWVEMYTKGR